MLGLQMKPKSCSNLAVHCIMSCTLVMVCMYASLSWQVRQELASLKLSHLHVSMKIPLLTSSLAYDIALPYFQVSHWVICSLTPPLDSSPS